MLQSIVASLLAVVVVIAVPLNAQDVVRKEAPPQIKELVGAVVQAVNGSAADFEAFAQQYFAPGLLKRQSATDREALHRRLSGTFGRIAVNGVRREGPDAPLLLQVKGDKRAGEIRVDIDSSEPPRILEIAADDGAAAADDVHTPPVSAAMTNQEIDGQLSAFFARLAEADVFSGVVLVARQGVPVHFKAYGMANREKKIANTVRTRFNIGSINKSFTQVAVQQLVQAGKLSLTDTLGTFFPDYPQEVTKAATVQQLLTHRAGVADFFGSEFSNAPKANFTSNADYFRFVSSRPPAFAPGERNQYCNGCYIALGAIIEKVTGVPYERYVSDQVFARAEMTDTGYPRSDRPADDIAIGYTRRGGGTLQSNVAMHGVTGSAAGGGYSTALDLLSYTKAVKSGRLTGVDRELAIAGGAPGTNAVVESRGDWTVIVLTNFDPPTGEKIGVALAGALASSR